MKCIDYDAKWLAEIVEDFPVWKGEFLARKRKAKSKSTAGSGAGGRPDKRRKSGRTT